MKSAYKREMRPLLGVIVIACIHFATVLALGVLAFVLQGDLTGHAAPSRAYTLVSGVVDVLEFPFVWWVRRTDAEKLAGFTSAAVCNSLLWGTVANVSGLAVARMIRTKSATDSSR